MIKKVMIMTTFPKKKQSGAALAIGLIFLLLATIVTVAGMRGSNIQERMTSNTNHKSLSFMIAEVGAGDVLDFVRQSEDFTDPDVEFDDPALDGFLRSITDTLGENNRVLQYAVTDVTPLPEGMIVEIQGRSFAGDSAQGSPEGITTIELRFERFFTPVDSEGPGGGEGARGPGGAGMISNNSIRVAGNITLEGSIHANANFEATGGSSTIADQGDSLSTISAGGTVRFNDINPAELDPDDPMFQRLLEDAGIVQIPRAIDYIACWINDEGLSATFPFSGVDEFVDYCSANEFPFDKPHIKTCDVSQGDLDQGAVYCDGDLEIKRNDNVSNGTIMASGDIEIRGSSSLGADGKLGVAFFAGGDLTFRGSADSFGVFWSDGQFTQRGASQISGLVRAGAGVEVEDNNDITMSGNVRYTQIDDLGDFLNIPDIRDPTSEQTQVASFRMMSLRERTGSRGG